MKKPSHILILLLVFISIGIITYWFLENFERVTETKYVGYQGKARYNSFLAAQYLLEKSGTPTQTVYSLSRIFSQLTPQDTVVLFFLNDTDLTTSQHQELLNWVKSGGHLIISCPTISSEETIFDRVGVTFREQEEVTLDEDDSDYEKIELNSPTQFSWNRYSLIVDFDKEKSLETRHEPHLSIEDDDGSYLFIYNIGRGYLSILSDLKFMTNSEIGKHDHASFLWYLVHYQRQVAKTWLISLRYTGANETPSLFELLWQHAQSLVITSVLLLIFWVWSISRRFGPLLPSLPRTRRRLLEHIEASGHFLWRYQQSHLLLATVRQAIFKRLEQVHPDWLTLPKAKLCQQLAQLGKLSPQQVEIALYQTQFEAEVTFTQTMFTQAVQTLITIKEKL